MESYQVVTQTAVNVFISSTVTTFVAEKRFPKNITIGELKVVFLSLLESLELWLKQLNFKERNLFAVLVNGPLFEVSILLLFRFPNVITNQDVCLIFWFNFLVLFSVKAKLELVTGANSSTMMLEVHNKEKQFVCSLTNDNALLGSFPIDDGMTIHVREYL